MSGIAGCQPEESEKEQGLIRSGVAQTLRELINISQLELVEDKSAETASYTVTKAHGEKCTRCWRWETSVGEHEEHLEICERCVEAVA
jgi:isoleucyl-tRNA synthetase